MPRAQTYSLFAVALEEARRGAGVLISHEALVEQALRVPDTKHEGLSDLDLSLLMQRVELGWQAGQQVNQEAAHV